MKMCTCNVLSGRKLLVIAAVVAAHVGVCAETNIPVPAVIGTYDDTCDCIFWGIADVRGSRNPIHVHESTKNDPYAYYNVVKEEIARRRAGCACRAQRP